MAREECMTRRRRGTVVTTWARIEARSYDDALRLLEQLLDHPTSLVQSNDDEWSIYVAADGPEEAEVVCGCGVDPSRVTMIESDDDFGEDGLLAPVADNVPLRRSRLGRS
jgi:hypothetical protein